MKAYRIKVDGREFFVEVEDAAVSSSPAVTPASAVSAPPAPVALAASAAPAPVKEAASPSTGGTDILSPLPGNVLNIHVELNAPVKQGQLLITLEAMKMENEIVAPSDGVVSSISVTKGQSVDTGVLLMTI